MTDTPSPRAVQELRGKVVRALVAHAGTARTDEYITAMAEAAQFNRRHPDRAIPAPFKILGRHPAECSYCRGEGAVVAKTTARISLIGAVTVQYDDELCSSCGGSGFQGVYGIGGDARAANNPLRA